MKLHSVNIVQQAFGITKPQSLAPTGGSQLISTSTVISDRSLLRYFTTVKWLNGSVRHVTVRAVMLNKWH